MLDNLYKSNSFSGCDIVPILYGREQLSSGAVGSLFEFGMLTTLSYSIHTDKRPIVPLGTRKPKAYVSGLQTIAGTMIFIVLNEHPLAKVIGIDKLSGNKNETPLNVTNDIALIPPFDLTLLLSNESGQNAILNMFGIEFIDEGFTVSVNDVYSELQAQYLCRDVSVLRETANNNKTVSKFQF